MEQYGILKRISDCEKLIKRLEDDEETIESLNYYQGFRDGLKLCVGVVKDEKQL